MTAGIAVRAEKTIQPQMSQMTQIKGKNLNSSAAICVICG